MLSVFDRASFMGYSDIEIEALNTKMTNMEVSFVPKDGNFDAMDLEIFYDEGNKILLEMHDLEFFKCILRYRKI